MNILSGNTDNNKYQWMNEVHIHQKLVSLCKRQTWKAAAALLFPEVLVELSWTGQSVSVCVCVPACLCVFLRVCVCIPSFGPAAFSAGFIVQQTADEGGNAKLHTLNTPTQTLQWFSEKTSGWVDKLLLYEHWCVTAVHLFVLCLAIAVRRWHSASQLKAKQWKRKE